MNQQLQFPPLNRCMYCGADGRGAKLSREHIFPFGLGGNVTLPSSSCKSCAAITGSFEQNFLRGILHSARIHLNIQTRRPKERPDSLPLYDGISLDNGLGEKYLVPIQDHPGILFLPYFAPPGILFGRPASSEGQILGTYIFEINNSSRKNTNVGRNKVVYEQFQPSLFMRMLAKIAHSFITALEGDKYCEYLLKDTILGKNDISPYYIGGEYPGIPGMEIIPLNPIEKGTLHQIGSELRIIGSESYIVTQIRLFAHLNPRPPAYTVIVGKLRD